MLIDQLLPDFERRASHSIEVRSRREAVYEAARRLDLSGSRQVRWLFRLRGMPNSALSLEGMQRMGFTLLGEIPGEEFVLGIVGKFWRPRGGIQRIADAVAFRNFDRPGYAKAAWNFFVTGSPDSPVTLYTETRIHCTDRASARRFAAYWAMIGPFSAWIRRAVLREVQRRCER